MGKAIKFPGSVLPSDQVFLPVTMQQFEDLTNEILGWVNAVANPAGEVGKGFDGEYFAQVLMSAIHAYDHKVGKVKKRELFESCVNRISCHVTYHAVQEIQKRIKAKSEASGESVETVPAVPPQSDEVLPDEVTGGPV